MKRIALLVCVGLVFLLAACSSSSSSSRGYSSAAALREEPTQVFWGDTHLHTSFSPDAFFFGNTTADPDTAYRYAKGYPVYHPYHKARIQIHDPLDFLDNT